MITIHKYRFKIDTAIHIKMPVGANILNVGVQDGWPTMWAIVNTEQPIADRNFYIYATGQNMDEMFGHDYIATLQLNGFVWHIFE
jgi:hypothetical protein